MSFSFRVFLVVALVTSFGFSLDRNAFTFTKYDFELRTNPDDQAIAARGKITLRNDSSQPQSVASLQISSTLNWRMIELNGEPLQYLTEPFTSDIDHTGKLMEAIVTLPAPVPPKGTVEMEVGYSGMIPKDATRLKTVGVPDAQALASDWDRVGQEFSGVRGVGHVAWYPIATEVAQISENTLFSVVDQWQQRQAQTEMKFRFCWITDEERSYGVVANGRFEGIGGGSIGGEGNRTGCTSYSFHNLGEEVPTFSMAPFEMLTRPAISLYYRLGDQPAAMDYANATERVQPWVEEWLGKSQEKVQVIELPDADAVPFESGAMLFTPLNKEEKVIQLTMAHQLAHASFKSPRRWISEGLAQFAQAIVREHQDGRRAALDFLSARQPVLAAAEKQNPEAAKASGDAGQSLTATTDDVYYRIKAMFVWWMLRDMLGDDTLKAALKNYRADQDKGPAYIQTLILAQTKRDLEWFFDDWVYRDRGLPDFKIATAAPRETLSNQFVIAVTVENSGSAGAEVTVRVATTTGDKTARLLVRAGQKEITRISVGGKPIEATVNDGSVPESEVSNNVFHLAQ
jgi:hypothetical protein